MELLLSELIDNVSQSQHLKDLKYSKLLKDVSHPNQLKDVDVVGLRPSRPSELLDILSQERYAKLRAKIEYDRSADPPKKRRVELTLNFPKNFQIKTFHFKYEKKLSSLTKLILQSIQFKHFYYVRDDIFYLLKSNMAERDCILQALYSIVIYLQNNLSINFFDMWIYEVYINESLTKNKFMIQPSQNIESCEYITIKLAYGKKLT